MTKAELVAQIATKADLNKASAERTLNVILDSIGEILAEKEKLTLTGFGSFVVEKREARIGRNPRTGSQIEIPAAKVVKFRVGNIEKCCTVIAVQREARLWNVEPVSSIKEASCYCPEKMVTALSHGISLCGARITPSFLAYSIPSSLCLHVGSVSFSCVPDAMQKILISIIKKANH